MVKQRIDPVMIWQKALEIAEEHPNLDCKDVDRLEACKDGSVIIHNTADWKKASR